VAGLQICLKVALLIQHGDACPAYLLVKKESAARLGIQ